MLAAPTFVGRNCEIAACTAGLFDRPPVETVPTPIGCLTPVDIVLTGGIITIDGRCGSCTFGDPKT